MPSSAQVSRINRALKLDCSPKDLSSKGYAISVNMTRDSGKDHSPPSLCKIPASLTKASQISGPLPSKITADEKTGRNTNKTGPLSSPEQHANYSVEENGWEQNQRKSLKQKSVEIIAKINGTNESKSPQKAAVSPTKIAAAPGLALGQADRSRKIKSVEFDLTCCQKDAAQTQEDNSTRWNLRRIPTPYRPPLTDFGSVSNDSDADDLESPSTVSSNQRKVRFAEGYPGEEEDGADSATYYDKEYCSVSLGEPGDNVCEDGSQLHSGSIGNSLEDSYIPIVKPLSRENLSSVFLQSRVLSVSEEVKVEYLLK